MEPLRVRPTLVIPVDISTSAALAPRPSNTSFEQRFEAALPSGRTESPPATHTVVRGENLSTIVRDYLRDSGHSGDNASVWTGVQAIARANGLRDANVIFPGQELDLSALQPLRTAPPLPMPAPTALAPAPAAPLLPAPPRLPISTARHTPAPPATAPLAPSGAQGGPALQPESETAPARKTAAPLESTASARRESPWARLLDAPARLTSDYGRRRDPFTGRPDWHAGIDLAVPSGTRVLAYDSGVVTHSGWIRGYGNAVIVEHAGGLETLYAHNARVTVPVGRYVDAGEAIAESGSTGRSTGPHVHFEVRKDGEAVNPVPYLAMAG